jgi:hypothetical protein
MLVKKPSVRSINNLTHPENSEIAKKFGFFADCLDIINQKAGEFYDFEIETHMSLVSYLQYCIKTNNESRTKFLIKQIKYVCRTHPFCKKNDLILKKYYPNVLIWLQAIIEQEGLTENSLTSIDKKLEMIESEMSKTYFSNVVKELLRYITCKHKLNSHKYELNYSAQIIFSHFYLNGYSRENISNFTGKLLSKKLQKDRDKIRTDAPLPSKLYKKLVIHNRTNKPFNQTLYNEIENFLKSRTIQQQVEGLLDFSNSEKYNYFFIFKVNGIWLNSEKEVIHGITFLDTLKFKKKINKKRQYNGVFDFMSIPSVLIEYHAKGHSQDEAVKQAISELRTKLNRIGLVLNKYLHLDTSAYIIPFDESNKSYFLNELNERNSLYEWDIKALSKREKLTKRNAFNRFLLEKERSLSEAIGEQNIEYSLHLFSKFLELISKDSLQNIKSRGGIQDKVLAASYILLLDEKHIYRGVVRNWAHNLLLNTAHAERKFISNEKMNKVINSKFYISLSENRKIFKQEHALYRVKKALRFSNESNVEAFNYYIRYFSILIQYRNVNEHLNKSEEQISRKLILSASILLNRIFRSIIKEFSKKSNKYLSPNEIINSLILEGKSKADNLGIVL